MELPALDRLPPIDVADVQEAKLFYEKYGLVCVRLLNRDQCGDLIKEQWDQVISRQPWTDDHKIRVCKDPIAEREDFLKEVVGPLSTPVRRKYEAGWPLHRGFGACCDPRVFHLPGVWGIRQDPRLYQLAAALTGTDELWVDVNRSIQKLPGQGETEFLHWDLNPFTSTDEDVAPTSVCGKVCYTQGIFVAVCGTHTGEFFSKFQTLYKPHYPGVSANAAKFGIDYNKPDPLGLVERQREFHIPPGCMVLWNNKLLHGHVKTPLGDPVSYGCYIGYFPAGSRERYKEVCGVDEREDRIASYRDGCAPKLWPSFDPIQFYPKRFQNFPRLLQCYIDKMPPDHPSITTRLTAQSKRVPHLNPWPVENYVPPELSSLGERLLGKMDWESSGSKRRHSSSSY